MPEPGVFNAKLIPGHDVSRLVVAGELDIATAPQVGEQLQALSREHVVLDLTAVTFLDSSGLRMILDAQTLLGERFAIIPSEPVARLLEIVGLADRLPTVEQARRP